MKNPVKTKKNPGGRPTILTEEVQADVVTAITGGAYLETAAAYANISKTVFFKWLKRGATAKSGRYRKFRVAIEKAMADCELSDLDNIKKHGDGFETVKTIIVMAPDKVTGKLVEVSRKIEKSFRRDWQAAAWRLERRFPDRWSRRVEFAGPGGDAPAVAAVILMPDSGREAFADRQPEVREDLLKAFRASQGIGAQKPHELGSNGDPKPGKNGGPAAE